MDLVAIFGNADKDKVLLTNLSSKGGGGGGGGGERTSWSGHTRLGGTTGCHSGTCTYNSTRTIVGGPCVSPDLWS